MHWNYVTAIAAAVFFFAHSVFAQTTNPPPDLAQHVSDNATLLTKRTTLFPQGVWRDDYASGNGAPPLFYEPSSSTCSLNSGAGDNGSQVPSADGKCWIAKFPNGLADIREFGALASPAVDNAPPIQAAINAASSFGLTVFIPAAAGQTSLNTNAATVASNVLHFASVPSTIQAGMIAVDYSYRPSLPFADLVTGVGSGTVTLASNALPNNNGSGVGSGDQIVFTMPYLVGATLVVPSNVAIIGGSETGTVLMLKNGVCGDLIQSQGATSLWGTNSTQGVFNVHFSTMTLDGNAANQTGCSDYDEVNLIAYYGTQFHWDHLIPENSAGHWFRTEWGPNGQASATNGTEVSDIDASYAGRDGWLYDGPHDIDVRRFQCGDAGQSADNTYYGVKQGGNSGGTWYAFHCYHDAEATNRVAAQFYSIGANIFTNSSFEGGRQQYQITNHGIDQHNGSEFYAHFGAPGTALVLDDGAMLCHSCSWQNTGPTTNNAWPVGSGNLGTSSQDVFAIQMGDGSGGYSAQGIISGLTLGFTSRGPLNFANASDGDDFLNLNNTGTPSTGATVPTGTVPATDTLLITSYGNFIPIAQLPNLTISGTVTSSGYASAGGTTPTITSCMGLGSGGSCALRFGTPSYGVVRLTTGSSGVSTTGTVVINGLTSGTNLANCNFEAIDPADSGSTYWPSPYFLILGYGTSSVEVQWGNNSGTLVSNAHVDFSYQCTGS